MRNKSWIVSLVVGALSGSVLAEISSTTESKPHGITYGLVTGEMKQGDFSTDTTYSGLYFRYNYGPVNSINVQTNLDITAGTLHLKDGALGTSGTMHSSVTEHELLLGYKFATPHPHLTVTPLLGLHSLTENNTAKTESGETQVDMDLHFGSTILGAAATYQLAPKWELGLTGKVVFARNGEMEFAFSTQGPTARKISTATALQNLNYYKLEAPVSYAITDSVGVFSMLEQTFNRTFKTDPTLESKLTLNAWKLRIGVLHRF